MNGQDRWEDAFGSPPGGGRPIWGCFGALAFSLAVWAGVIWLALWLWRALTGA
jgi:hypothetical protein